MTLQLTSTQKLICWLASFVFTGVLLIALASLSLLHVISSLALYIGLVFLAFNLVLLGLIFQVRWLQKQRQAYRVAQLKLVQRQQEQAQAAARAFAQTGAPAADFTYNANSSFSEAIEYVELSRQAAAQQQRTKAQLAQELASLPKRERLWTERPVEPWVQRLSETKFIGWLHKFVYILPGISWLLRNVSWFQSEHANERTPFDFRPLAQIEQEAWLDQQDFSLQN